MDVENLAVSKISSIVSACPRLKGYLASNDKTPFTDGHIDLYDLPKQTKANWRGRVTVQIKGRTRHSKPGVSLKHPVARTDLEAYQKDSGVLYFVVAVHPKTGKCSPYFAVLSPAKIEWVLREHPSSKTISIDFHAFPEDPKLVEPILRLALKTRDQNQTLKFDPKLFDHVQSITIHTASELDFSRPLLLSPGETDFALVLTTTGGMSFPIGGELQIFPDEYSERSVDVRLESNGVGFDTVSVKRASENVIEARMPGGLSVRFKQTAAQLSASISLSPEGNLSDRMKAVRFCLGVSETSSMTIGGHDASFAETPGDDEPELRSYLNTLILLTELFEVLNVDESLVDISKVSKEQIKDLRVIHRAFVGKQELTNSSLKTSRAIQPVGSWNLMFLVLPGVEVGKWRLVNPFDPESRQQFSWHADDISGGVERIRVTSFDILDSDVLPSVLNLHLDGIVSAYHDLSGLPETTKLANRKVLELIAASDSTPSRRDEFLHAAGELNDWLVRVEGETPIHLINRWQIGARGGTLTAADRKRVRALSREALTTGAENADLIAVACALLLEDRELASDLLEELAPDRLELLETWPIWVLWRRLAQD